MRINSKKYPRLASIFAIHKGAVMPMYVSKAFFLAAEEMQDKFTEGQTVGDMLNDFYATVLHGQPFILLLNDGVIMHGVFGFVTELWHGERCAVRVEWNAGDKEHFITGKTHPQWRRGWSIGQIVGAIKMILCFQKYSETKYKVLPANGKIIDDDEVHCRYKSDFGFKVGLLTENWYTQSAKTNPFMVRRHMRMQRCGKGLSERKAIWVDTYWKDGYTKGAYKDL